jgi:hypothetical protein
MRYLGYLVLNLGPCDGNRGQQTPPRAPPPQHLAVRYVSSPEDYASPSREALEACMYQILQNSESREATLISNVKSAALTFSLYVGTIQTMQLAKLRSLLCIFCCEIIGRSRIRKVVWRSTELCGRTHQGAEAATFRRNYLVIICPVAHTTEWGKLP